MIELREQPSVLKQLLHKWRILRGRPLGRLVGKFQTVEEAVDLAVPGDLIIMVPQGASFTLPENACLEAFNDNFMVIKFKEKSWPQGK